MLAQLAQAVRERRLSSVELVRESIERIGRLDPALNAVTAVWPEEALAEAEKLDQRGPEGPLAGLPLLVKDNTDVAGKVTSYASRTMLDRPPAERSEVTVERLVAAGAIPIGRTNLPEFAFQGYTDSKLFGPTRKDADDLKLLAGEVILIAFDIEGLKVAPDGEVQYSVGMEVTNNKDNKTLFKKEPEELKTISLLGTSRQPAFTSVEIGTDTPPANQIA